MIGIKLFNNQAKAYYLQLKPGTYLEVEELLPAFDELLENGLFSLPINVPFTPDNLVFLGYPNHLATPNTSIPEYWRCDVEYYGLPYLSDAKFKILSHSGKFNATQGEFVCIITGGKGLFGSEIKNKKLADLQLEGPIEWDTALDSRQFANDVMGTTPTYLVKNKLQFAPILWENFIDDQRSDYDGELLADDTVNHIVKNPIYSNGWTFGRANPINPTLAVAKGTTNYNDYRTIPFFNLIWTIQQLFLEHGYSLSGDFLSVTDMHKVHIFNNRAIERYDTPFVFDINNQIIPSQHMPDMLIVDFLVAIQTTFNLRFDFLGNKNVQLNMNKELLKSENIIDLTAKLVASYESSERHPIVENGYTFGFEWDSNDSVVNDRVKNPAEFEVLGEADTLSDWLSNPLSATGTDNSYVLIKAENYYYNYQGSTAEWLPTFENLYDIRFGKEQVTYKPTLSPLCHAYKLNVFGTQERLNMCATRQHGSYWNNPRKLISKPCALRIFYIDNHTSTLGVGSPYSQMPMSFTHNTDSNNDFLTDISLCWGAEAGLFNYFYKAWIAMLFDSKILKASFNLNIHDLSQLSQTKLIMILNSIFILKKLNTTLKKGSQTTLELVKL